MPNSYIVKLGKTSVPEIRKLDGLHSSPEKPLRLRIKCKQVPSQLSSGDYALIAFGSDNSEGRPTDWVRGLRAIGRFVSRSGGSGYNDEQTLDIDIGIVLSQSITQRDFLVKAPTAFAWFSSIPQLGLNASSQQTVQEIKTSEEHQDLRALLYAIEAVQPGFKALVQKIYPDLMGLLRYIPPDPGFTLGAISTTSTAESESPDAELPSHVSAVFCLALASKGFVLISGPSGTGKSTSIRDISRALDYALGPEFSGTVLSCKPANCLALVRVESGWTDGTPLLGFRNPFGVRYSPNGERSEGVRQEVWEPPAALRLLLRATELPDQPHFLVLDEMNLSHVERYFAQFLSLMEANRALASTEKFLLLEPDAVRLIAETLASSGQHPFERHAAEKLAAQKLGLVLPENVFIVGTVNVDETTYMFSPKVLDRAHVVEMDVPDPVQYLRGAVKSQAAVLSIQDARTLLSEAINRKRESFWERKKPEEVLNEVGAGSPFESEMPAIKEAIGIVLSGVQTLLEPIGFAFAYRTINEFCAYVSTYVSCKDPHLLVERDSDLVGWQAALDRAVYQKLLPRLHGNRRQLGESLRALQSFLSGSSGKYRMGNRAIETKSHLSFALPLSAKKLERMILRLEATGHTTFVD